MTKDCTRFSNCGKLMSCEKSSERARLSKSRNRLRGKTLTCRKSGCSGSTPEQTEGRRSLVVTTGGSRGAARSGHSKGGNDAVGVLFFSVSMKASFIRLFFFLVLILLLYAVGTYNNSWGSLKIFT